MNRLPIVMVSLLLIGSTSDAGAEPPDEAFTRLDVNEDARLSGKEITDAIRPFDANGDGRITREEFLAGMTKAEDPEAEFTARDLNEDGWLSGKEVKGSEGYDTDGDGEVTREEYLAGRAKGTGRPRRSRDEAKRAFDDLDVTEDGFLSGTEKKTVAGYDADEDGRVTLEEFVTGFVGEAAESTLTPAALELRISRAIQGNNAKAILELAAPELAAQIDEPILRFMLEMMPARLGPRQDKTIRVSTTETTVGGKPLLQHDASVEYESGAATYQFRSSHGRLVGISIASDDVKSAGLVLLERLNQDEEFSNEIKESFAPRGAAMISAILTGDDKAAYNALHPLARKQLPFETTAAGFAKARELFGALQGLELVTMRVEGDGQGELRSIIFGYEAKCEKRLATATVLFEVAGYQGALVGYNIVAAEDAPASPRKRPELALRWQRLTYPKQGWRFEIPGEPKTTTDDKGTVKHTVEVLEHGLVFNARVIRGSQEGREQESLDLFIEALSQSDTAKVLDVDKAPLGKHPGAVIFLQLSKETANISRRVILSDTIYELDVTTTRELTDEAEGSINRFLESMELVGARPAATEDSLPAPPAAPGLPRASDLPRAPQNLEPGAVPAPPSGSSPSRPRNPLRRPLTAPEPPPTAPPPPPK